MDGTDNGLITIGSGLTLNGDGGGIITGAEIYTIDENCDTESIHITSADIIFNPTRGSCPSHFPKISSIDDGTIFGVSIESSTESAIGLFLNNNPLVFGSSSSTTPKLVGSASLLQLYGSLVILNDSYLGIGKIHHIR